MQAQSERSEIRRTVSGRSSAATARAPAASRAARPRAARSIRRRSTRCARCSATAPRRRDLLIEHLHLIQDKYGHHLRRASGGARGRDEAGAHRGLRGRDLLRAFRRGEGRRDAAAAGHRARVRLAVLRDGRRRTVCWRDLPKTLGARRARRARALHGRLRSRAGLRRRPRAGDAGDDASVADGGRSTTRIAHAWPSPTRFRRTIMADGGYRAPARRVSPASARATT